jgi:hypothetical protein
VAHARFLLPFLLSTTIRWTQESHLTAEIARLQAANAQLQKKCEIMELNLSSVFKTAVVEIQRYQSQIAELRARYGLPQSPIQ